MLAVYEILIDGIRIEYGMHNLDSILSKPCIVFFHGTPGTLHQASVYAEDLIEEGYPVLTWSRPGYGNSDIPDMGCPYVTQAGILNRLLAELGLVYVIGYGVSGGVPVMMEYLARYADTMPAVILESSVITKYDCGDRTWYQKMSDGFLYTKMGHYFFSRMIDSYPKLFNLLTLYRYSSLGFREALREARYMTEDKCIVNRLRRFMEDISDRGRNINGYLNDFKYLKYNRLDLLKYLPESVLTLHGSSDVETPIHEADRVRDTVRGSWYVQVINGSHVLPLSSRHRYISRKKLEFVKCIGHKAIVE